MYNNKLVAAIKSNGKVLREFGEEVYIPFGSEYSILIKNLHSVRAIVRIYIDGKNVTGSGDGGLVIEANKELNLERSISNGNNNKGNRFKFIERTTGIESHRGIKLEDGLLRIEFEFEKEYPKYVNNHWLGNERNIWNDSTMIGDHLRGTTGDNPTDHSVFTSSTIDAVAGAPQASGSARSTSSTRQYCAKGISAGKNTLKSKSRSRDVENDVGITVEGSISKQKFKEASWFPTEDQTHVIVLKLLGETEDNKPVKVAVTTKTKPTCTTCGRTNKATAKFCQECSTSLQIVA